MLEFSEDFRRLEGRAISANLRSYLNTVMPHAEVVWVKGERERIVLVLAGRYRFESGDLEQISSGAFKKRMKEFQNVTEMKFKANNPRSEISSQLVQTGFLTVLSIVLHYMEGEFPNTDLWYSYIYSPAYRLDIQISGADQDLDADLKRIQQGLNRFKQELLTGNYGRLVFEE